MDKKPANARSLILLTALIAFVIVVAAWFLLISPQLSGASEANAQAAQQEATNANTQVEVNKLRSQFEHMEEYEAQLAGLQVQIPTVPGYADLQRMFAAVAAENKVVITSLQFGSATEMKVKEPESDDAAATEDPTAEPSPEATADSSSGAKSSAKLYAIPTSVTVTGNYDDVMSFLNALQTSDERLVLITTVSLTKPSVADQATSSASEAGATGVFAGSTFVMTSSTPTEQPAGSSDASPSPSPSPNP